MIRGPMLMYVNLSVNVHKLPIVWFILDNSYSEKVGMAKH